MFTPPTSRSRSGTPLRSFRKGSSLHSSRLRGDSFLAIDSDKRILKRWGKNDSIPVKVSEILQTLPREGSLDASVGISNSSDWAWLVRGRKCLVWKFKNITRSISNNCRELSLPASDVSHTAGLVNVFCKKENGSPSCLAVSPEGIIRYWPSIAHEGSSLEISAELQGQECSLLSNLMPLGSLCMTTTSSVLLISISPNSNSGEMLSCRPLRTGVGLLGGIRRMSSLFWSGLTPQSEAKLITATGLSSPIEKKTKNLFLLTVNSLQKWTLSQEEEDSCDYDWDARTVIRNSFLSRIWPNSNGKWIQVWLLDLKAIDDTVSILCAGMNQNNTDSPLIHFAVGNLFSGLSNIPTDFNSFILLNHTISYLEGDKGDTDFLLSTKFLLSKNKSIYLYNESTVLCHQVDENKENEIVDLRQNDEETHQILGAGVVDGIPLFVSTERGSLSFYTFEPVTQGNNQKLDSFNSSLSGSMLGLSDSLNVSTQQFALDDLSVSESKMDRLKAAFLFYCQRNSNQALSIMDSLCSSNYGHGETLDSSLQSLVVQMSTDLIDDFPASDSRWMESVSQQSSFGLGSSNSLLIKHQLEDKQKACELFINFLKDLGFWSKLTGIQGHEFSTLSTSCILGEHAEKITAALALRSLNAEFSTVMDPAITHILSKRTHIKNSNTLTPQDHFYREISRIEEIFEGLHYVLMNSISKDSPRSMIHVAKNVNTIVISVLKDVLNSRMHRKEGNDEGFEYLPWTCSSGPKGLRSLLLYFTETSSMQIIPLIDEPTLKALLYQQIVEMADITYDGYRRQISSLSSSLCQERKNALIRDFDSHKQSLLFHLLSKGYYEESAALAEKYHEFSVLVKLCESTNDRQRLERYMTQFSSESFSDFVFDWHVREGKQSKLLTSNSDPKRAKELSKFLSGHAPLSWLHDIQTESFFKASSTLKELASRENELLLRKKTLLNLTKLTALASDESEDVIYKTLEAVENEINVITAQEQLPSSVIESLGFDSDSMYVLSPIELIECYTGVENVECDVIDFKKALDLLDYLPQNDKEETMKIKLRIWARSVLRDTWKNIDCANPVTGIQETLFYKLVEFCHLQGYDLQNELCSVDQLLHHPELSPFSKDSNFEFLIRITYEHLLRTYDIS